MGNANLLPAMSWLHVAAFIGAFLTLATLSILTGWALHSLDKRRGTIAPTQRIYYDQLEIDYRDALDSKTAR